MERAATYFGQMSILYEGGENEITARVELPKRNLPKAVRLRFRTPEEHAIKSVFVNGKEFPGFKGEWVDLPPELGRAEINITY